MISTRELEDIVQHINNKFDALFKAVAEIEVKLETIDAKEEKADKNANKKTIKR
jgi:hypothetical protein|tara:strand:- start:2736 stop:2897 length:162 start_codon:yes stop_codon:yes gene_type:complete